jgi:hypothetical protein
MTTNVPAPVWTPNGFIIPTEADILAGVQADINAAFGGNLNPALETPQGQLATSETAAIGNANDTFLFYTNQVDPAFAEGRMQDAIGRIYYIERQPGAATTAQCTCTGLANTIIPIGALALATDGSIYICQQLGTIPSSGSIVLPFACSVIGPVPCVAHSVSQIYKAIPGWDTIDNAEAGVTGVDVENRADFEARRSASTALNSVGSLPSIRGVVLDVAGVVDAFVTENATNSPLTIGDVTLAANSIYVCAAGGVPLDVATAIWSRKAPGCSYNGSTSVTIYDTSPGYAPPYPSYIVLYQIPDPLPIVFSVNLINSASVPSDAVTQIQSAIIDAFSGGDGRPRVRIGTNVLASRFYSPVAALGSWANILDILITSPNDASNGAAVTGSSISGTTLTIGAVSSGSVANGQSVMDLTGAVLPGTVIVSGSGTSWQVNLSQTVASEDMTLAAPTQFSQLVEIDQIPNAQAANIFVNLV